MAILGLTEAITKRNHPWGNTDRDRLRRTLKADWTPHQVAYQHLVSYSAQNVAA